MRSVQYKQNICQTLFKILKFKQVMYQLTPGPYDSLLYFFSHCIPFPICTLAYTVNNKSSAVQNFHVFHGFLIKRESFPY